MEEIQVGYSTPRIQGPDLPRVNFMTLVAEAAVPVHAFTNAPNISYSSNLRISTRSDRAVANYN
eukprot:1327006-Amorphochlora_amoeboformis.AAC.1